MNSPTSIPAAANGSQHSGWQTKPLGELCEYDRSQAVHRGLPYVGMEHIESQTGRFIGSTEPTSVKSNTFRFSPRHVLYGRLRPYLNKVFAPDFEGHCSTEIFPLLPKPDLSREFLQYWLMSDAIVDRINATCTGARMPRANMDALLTFEMPAPSLLEQHRLVTLLDQAFDAIATAQVNTEKNLQNAHALFESHLQSVFTKRGNGWVEKRLGEIAEFKNGLNFNQSSKGQSVQVVGVGDFQNNYVVPLDDLKSVTIDGDLGEHYAIRENDILTVRSNGSKDLVGRCMLVPSVTETISYSGFIIRIRFDPNVIAPRFLLHFMKCSATRERLTREGGGTNISNINQEKLSGLIVSLPPSRTQHAVVAQLEELSAETQRLTSLYQQKLTALAALKKSLLHQAFSGQL